MADIELKGAAENVFIIGDNLAARTFKIGQQVTFDDIVDIDVPFTTFTVNGQRVAFKNNYSASVAPTATDDAASGYEVSSQWFDTTADEWHICLDATTSAAVWITQGAITISGTPVLDQMCLWNSATQLRGTADWTYDGTTHTIADAKNFSFNTSNGTKFGTATGQKLGFWNVTPIIQPADALQAVVGVITTVGANTGTAGAGLTLIGDTTSVDQASNIMDDFVALQEDILAVQVLLNQLRSDLVDAGIIKGAA